MTMSMLLLLLLLEYHIFHVQHIYNAPSNGEILTTRSVIVAATSERERDKEREFSAICTVTVYNASCKKTVQNTRT